MGESNGRDKSLAWVRRWFWPGRGVRVGLLSRVEPPLCGATFRLLACARLDFWIASPSARKASTAARPSSSASRSRAPVSSGAAARVRSTSASSARFVAGVVAATRHAVPSGAPAVVSYNSTSEGPATASGPFRPSSCRTWVGTPESKVTVATPSLSPSRRSEDCGVISARPVNVRSSASVSAVPTSGRTREKTRSPVALMGRRGRRRFGSAPRPRSPARS